MRWSLALFFLILGCEKVPLRENPAQVNFVRSHWFENEKTQYLFFRIDGLKPAQARMNWPSKIEIRSPGGLQGLKAGSDGFAPLDFGKAVHRHRLVTCGERSLCGSYSFRAEKPLSLSLRFRYHQDSELGVGSEVFPQSHSANGGPSSQSALLYGVFNTDNSRVQIRVHDNFGDPDSLEVENFGMQRSFAIRDLRLTSLSNSLLPATGPSTGNGLLFPARVCDSFLTSSDSTNLLKFEGLEAWALPVFDPQDLRGIACFRARNLDKSGNLLTESPALARRNPVLAPETLRIRPPLAETFQIGLTLAYCPGRPESPSLGVPDFLSYQRRALGLQKSEIDACFAIGEEDRFAQDLDRVITMKLREARLNNPSGADFFLKVILHHRLSPKIKRFHEIIQEKLTERVRAESALISPRLVGGFVYDSQPMELRLSQAIPYVVWCPRASSSGDEVDAGCSPGWAGEIEATGIKINIPLGVFPSVDEFMDQYRRFGDRGLSQNPKLQVLGVRTNVNSISDPNSGKLYTFFDGQRIHLKNQEQLRFCRENDTDHLLSDLVFQSVTAHGSSAALDLQQTQDLIRRRDGDLNLNLGLWWDSPFIGIMSYEVPLRGKIAGIIGFSRNFDRNDKMGDPRWLNGTWNLTPLLQKCLRHCDHPYFDEAGVYQIQSSWLSTRKCVTPHPAEPQ